MDLIKLLDTSNARSLKDVINQLITYYNDLANQQPDLSSVYTKPEVDSLFAQYDEQYGASISELNNATETLFTETDFLRSIDQDLQTRIQDLTYRVDDLENNPGGGGTGAPEIDAYTKFEVDEKFNTVNQELTLLNNNQTGTANKVTLLENDVLVLDVDLSNLKDSLVAVYEDILLAQWTELSNAEPYKYSSTATLDTSIYETSVVELINNDAVAFATYGFAIGSITGQEITFYAIEQPTESVTLKIMVEG